MLKIRNVVLRCAHHCWRGIVAIAKLCDIALGLCVALAGLGVPSFFIADRLGCDDAGAKAPWHGRTVANLSADEEEARLQWCMSYVCRP